MGEWIAQILKGPGHECFLQDDDILLGNDFVEKMKVALEKCDHAIAVLSPDHLRKPRTTAELNAAYRLDPIGEKRTLLIVRVCDIDGTRPSRKATFRTFISKLPEGRDRIVIKVDPSGAPAVQFLDEKGTVFAQLPPDRK